MGRVDSMYASAPSWLQHVFLNAHALRIRQHRYGRRYRRAMRDLLEQENCSTDTRLEWQNSKLRSIVEVAYRRSPFYRGVMDRRGLRPRDFQSIEDLRKLPVIDKETVREHAVDLLTASSPRRGWWSGHTSGTTGTPLSLWYDRDTCIMTNAVDGRSKAWCGMQDDSWIGLFLGRMIAPLSVSAPPFWRTNWIHRQVWFSSFHLKPEYLAHYVDEIRRRNLRFLEGYPSTLYILARYLQDTGQVLPMTAVITSSETLHQVQRETIEAAFCCSLFDFYAMAERVIYASECEMHSGKHVAEEYGVLEVVDEAGEPKQSGSPGYLVGTSLHNTAMPLLRYRLDDVSYLIPEPCECGRTLVRMGDVATKAEDFIWTPDGRCISPSIMTHPFKSLRFVEKSQIVQTDIDKITVKIVPSRKGGETTFRAVDEESLRASLLSRLGARMNLEILVVKEIEREQSGKFRWIISEVQRSEQIPWDVLQ